MNEKLEAAGEPLASIEDSVLLQGILQSLEGYCLFDHKGILIFCSDAYLNMLPGARPYLVPGISFEDCIRILVETKCLKNIPVVGDIDSWITRHSQSLRDEQDKRYHYHLPDGRWIRINGKQLPTHHWLFTATEVTLVRRDEQALQRTEEKFKSFATLSSDWFWELDQNLCYLYHSAHNLPLTRIKSDDLVGQSRIDTLDNRVIKNDEYDRHNQLLRAHQPVDTLLTWLDKDGVEIFSHIRAQPKFNKSGEFTGYLGCGRDVTRSELLSRKLEHLAMHDDLTGMLNRRSFESSLSSMVDQQCAGDTAVQGNCSLAFVDLDQFKLVNDDGGHLAGDQLLKELSSTFHQCCGPDAVLSRLGGDEFGIILRQDINTAYNTINLLIQEIAGTEFVWNDRRFSIGASAGVTPIYGDNISSKELMSRVDVACCSAKRAGRNQVHLYDRYNPVQNQQQLEQQQASTLRNALNNQHLLLYLQPIVPMQGQEQGYRFETLLRMLDDAGKVVSCGALIPAAEKYDLMQQVDSWVVSQVIAVLQRLQASGPDVTLSVNLSGNSLSNPEQLASFQKRIVDSGVNPANLCFEITETSAIRNISAVTEFIQRLKDLGCKFSLDDFGSGMSSFGYLKSLPVDYLKIDGSFVSNMLEDHACRSIVSAINGLGHELGMLTVGEFVEDEATSQLLADMGVDYGQGFGLGVPRDLNEVLAEIAIPVLRTGT